MAQIDAVDCLGDWKWRLANLYYIVDESGKKVKFSPNTEQLDLLSNLHNNNLILKARQLGFCVALDTRILTSELRWIRVADLQVGDEVVAVDERPPGGRGMARRMRTATVLDTVLVHHMAYRIRFDDGREVVCTDQHPWLSKKAGDTAEWRSLSGSGNQVVGRLKVGTRVRWVAKPWGASEVDDGWFGGMLDGEGSISKSNSSASINVSQRVGSVWDRLVAYCENRGYSHCIESDKAERLSKHGKVPVPKIVFGRMDEMFRLIGQTRPTRFIGRRFWENRELPGKRNGGIGWAAIVSIEPVGEIDLVDLQTSSGTYIAEGFVSHNTTLIDIMGLDQAIFTPTYSAAIIAHGLAEAGKIFRNKVKFPWDSLPVGVKALNPTVNDSASELVFSNGSSIYVGTSGRSGTLQFLHISEYGKICRRFPDKASEIKTGSLPAVHAGGLTFVESTAEGTGGHFYEMVSDAQKRTSKPNEHEFKLHFYPWWRKQSYRMSPDGVRLEPQHVAYFKELATKGIELDAEQQAWYTVKYRLFKDDMLQEYPSTPEEAFSGAMEERYYASQMLDARKKGRIKPIPTIPNKRVNTFWDLGRDTTAIWFHQYGALEHRMIDYLQDTGKTLDYYAKEIQRKGYMLGTIYLPHDAGDQSVVTTSTAESELKKLFPGVTVRIIPRVSQLYMGINLTRNIISETYFDEVACSEGIDCLDNYRKKWNESLGNWSDEPVHDKYSHGADAFRQFAQGWESSHEEGLEPRTPIKYAANGWMG